MEFYLMANQVKVAEIQEAFRKTTEYNFPDEMYDLEVPTKPELLLTLNQLSVDPTSNPEEEWGERASVPFEAADLNRILGQNFADVKLELLIFPGWVHLPNKLGSLEDNLTAYMLLSGMENATGRKINILERLEHAFGENEVNFEIELTLAYLRTRQAPVSLKSVVTFKGINLKYCSLPQRIGGHSEPTPATALDFWETKTGFLHVNLSVKVCVDQDAGNYFLKFGSHPRYSMISLEDIYLKNSDVAVELLKAGRKYKEKELETEMEKVLMSKGVKDLEYFSVEAALNLYLLAKDKAEFEQLKDKAVRVLKNYIGKAGDKLNESVEYQNFFRNDPQEAMKLSHLYGRPS